MYMCICDADMQVVNLPQSIGSSFEALLPTGDLTVIDADIPSASKAVNG
jgi:hypothetical protein